MTDRIVPALLWLLAVLFIAGVVHIVSILILPQVAPDDAYMRIAAAREVGVVAILPRPASHQNTVPFRDPAVASAICRYDLREGPVRVGTALGDSSFVAMSFHSRSGLPFYGLTDRSGNDGRLDVLLMSSNQLEKMEAADGEDEPVRDVRVTSPTDEGFVEFDVLPRVGGYPAAEKALGSVTCKIERDF